jgi:hypothetical protein
LITLISTIDTDCRLLIRFALCAVEWEALTSLEFASASLEEVTDRSTAVEGALFDRVQTNGRAVMQPCGILMQATRGEEWTHYETYVPVREGGQYAPTLLHERVTVGQTVLVESTTRLLRLHSSGKAKPPPLTMAFGGILEGPYDGDNYSRLIMLFSDSSVYLYRTGDRTRDLSTRCRCSANVPSSNLHWGRVNFVRSIIILNTEQLPDEHCSTDAAVSAFTEYVVGKSIGDINSLPTIAPVAAAAKRIASRRQPPAALTGSGSGTQTAPPAALTGSGSGTQTAPPAALTGSGSGTRDALASPAGSRQDGDALASPATAAHSVGSLVWLLKSPGVQEGRYTVKVVNYRPEDAHYHIQDAHGKRSLGWKPVNLLMAKAGVAAPAVPSTRKKPLAGGNGSGGGGGGGGGSGNGGGVTEPEKASVLAAAASEKAASKAADKAAADKAAATKAAEKAAAKESVATRAAEKAAADKAAAIKAAEAAAADKVAAAKSAQAAAEAAVQAAQVLAAARQTAAAGAPPPLAPGTPAHQPISRDDSPPGSVRQLRKQLRGLKGAQAIPGQTAADLANRAYQISEMEYELEERQRKFKKYGHW